MPLAQRILSTTVLGLLLCTLAVFGIQPVQAGHGGNLEIDSASWDGSTLSADGGADKPKRGGGPVTVHDAGSGANLGTANLRNNGSWTFSGGTCADSIYAQQDGVSTAAFPVSGPGCGGGGNNPPTLDPIGDKSVTVGNNLTFSVSANDPDGNGTLTLSTTGVLAGASFTDNGNGNGSFEWLGASPVGNYDVTFTVDDNAGQPNSTDSETITISVTGGNVPPVANNDSASTLVNTNVDINVVANDTDSDGTVDATSVVITGGPGSGGAINNGDGTVTYSPDTGFIGSDSFTYTVNDDQGATSNEATVSITVSDVPPPQDFPDQTDFKIMMNYELGMHCTGFEFAYCCVLPAYNSILAQVVKPNTTDPDHNGDYARLMEGDPVQGTDGLGRQTVLRDLELDGNGDFKKYVLKYWHDAQPRNDGNGKVQTDTLISAVEGNSLLSWNTVFDSAALNPDGSFVTGSYNGSDGVVLGDGDLTDPTDNYQNAIWNHLYFYEDLEGSNSTGTSLEADKIRLGVSGHVEYLENCGPALHPMGPTGSDGNGAGCGTGVGNVLTYSGEHGTVVFTQMKVLENLPIMLTSPDIWEALGLPLTPFEDSIDFFGDPGLVDEDSVRPFVAMKAQMYYYDGGANDTPVLDGAGAPVIGFGTAPIDIPNCERCHSNAPNTPNTPNNDPAQWALVQQEYNFWNGYYGIDTLAGDADWYSRLKSAAISMLHGHDVEHGTGFTVNYPGSGAGLPQNTRLGHESIICQKCHADNVIAVVKSATHGGAVIPPVTEAIHNNHRGVSDGGIIAFGDSQGRNGGCQGCHPAHRSSGDMAGYPITLTGENFYANSDNRDANGGCFVGRDVHSNPNKDDPDGADTPEHLNAMGTWLSDNVFNDGNSANGGLWCTNCHQQLSQELWKAENVVDLVNAQPGDPGHVREPSAGATLVDVANVLGISLAQAESWLDPRDPAKAPTTASGLPRTADETHTIWEGDPGLCDHVATLFGAPANPAQDGNVATIEVNLQSNPIVPTDCSTGVGLPGPDCDGQNGPDFSICGSLDGDGDVSVNILDFCTTDDCVAAAQGTLTGPGQAAVPVPMSAATDGRDHWLSPGEPHCADCHAAPYVEQSGNINAYPPFNYPRKASLMRYSKGHQNISCQGCHESIHGLYPVTPDIDTTSYAQAASLNHDGSHGPLKCGTCHEVNGDGVPSHIEDGLLYEGQPIVADYDAAVSWMHTFTDEADPLGDYCLNCHQDNRSDISSTNKTWTEHSFKGRSSREMMDKVELSQLGHVAGDPAFENPETTVCTSCHGDRTRTLARRGCTTKWKNHLIEGRASESVWEYVSTTHAGSTCGW